MSENEHEADTLSQVCPHDLCTGCAACANTCTHDAITMSEDELGYIHPHIATDLCTGCKLCQTVCPVLHPVELHEPRRVFATACKDAEERRTSSSGGAATAAGRYIIEQGGIVYGCAQQNFQDIRHIRVEQTEELAALKGSKYVQSHIGPILRNIRKDLRNGKEVLFVGTPCQVAGLRSFLRKDNEHLATIDLICHGVPPQRMLREDVTSQAQRLQIPLKDLKVAFRWKAQYGIQFGIQFGKALDGTPRRICLPHDPYITAFWTGLSFRENCHQCPYARSARTGDLTIGDFWGLGREAPTQFKIREGVSLVLVNTAKGQTLWDKMSSNMQSEERTLNEAVRGNANLRQPSQRPPTKDSFNGTYRKTGDLAIAVKTAIPTREHLKMHLMEGIKRQRILVTFLKTGRRIIHILKHHE